LVANEGEPAHTQKRQVFFLLGRVRGKERQPKKKKSIVQKKKGKKKNEKNMKKH